MTLIRGQFTFCRRRTFPYDLNLFMGIFKKLYVIRYVIRMYVMFMLCYVMLCTLCLRNTLYSNCIADIFFRNKCATSYGKSARSLSLARFDITMKVDNRHDMDERGWKGEYPESIANVPLLNPWRISGIPSYFRSTSNLHCRHTQIVRDRPPGVGHARVTLEGLIV